VQRAPKPSDSTSRGDINTVDKWNLAELELICRGCGLKSTRQLRAILEILTTATDHPNALDIYDRAPSTIGISLATIYRSLRRLVDCGIVVRLYSGENKVRYVVAPMQGKPNTSKLAKQTS
jgi:Fe2+ or Zn2+ uptake regulation protein